MSRPDFAGQNDGSLFVLGKLFQLFKSIFFEIRHRKIEHDQVGVKFLNFLCDVQPSVYGRDFAAVAFPRRNDFGFGNLFR